MGLRINTNIAALNAQRNLRVTNVSLNKTFERLSSGLRINRAADDAAGLAISEKLRAQIRGYSQAVRNSQDGINLIQTAEGAINETVNILQRMRELAIQAANDTNTHSDRLKIQEEIIQLRQELTRLAQTTEFNTRTLLDGSLEATQVSANPKIDLEQNFRVGDTAATVTNIQDFIVGTSVNDTFSFSGISADLVSVDVAFQLKLVALDLSDTTVAATNLIGLQIHSSVADGLVSVNGGATTFTLGSLTVTNGIATIGLQLASNPSVILGSIQINLSNISLEDVGKTGMLHITSRQAAITQDKALTFHVGPNEGQIVRVNVDKLTAEGLRLEDLTVVGTLDPRISGRAADDADLMRAQESIGVIDEAIDQVNSLRARLGALQNRLESTIRSLEISHENLSAAESRIRDADVAKETASLTRSQILVQAGTAILAQANVSTQSALALLQ